MALAIGKNAIARGYLSVCIGDNYTCTEDGEVHLGNVDVDAFLSVEEAKQALDVFASNPVFRDLLTKLEARHAPHWSRIRRHIDMVVQGVEAKVRKAKE